MMDENMCEFLWSKVRELSELSVEDIEDLLDNALEIKEIRTWDKFNEQWIHDYFEVIIGTYKGYQWGISTDGFIFIGDCEVYVYDYLVDFFDIVCNLLGALI